MGEEIVGTAEAFRRSQRKRAIAERDLHLAQAAELQAWLDDDASMESEAKKYDEALKQQQIARFQSSRTAQFGIAPDEDEWEYPVVRKLFNGNRAAFDLWKGNAAGRGKAQVSDV